MTPLEPAHRDGLIGCRRCARVWPDDRPFCDRCGSRLTRASHTSLRKVWFWWVLGLLAYIPANLWPMLETRMLLTTSTDTIVAGAFKLAAHGSVLIAIVILVASVAIPVAKFAAIAYLALGILRGDVHTK